VELLKEQEEEDDHVYIISGTSINIKRYRI